MKRTRAFTLLELLVVIAIIGVLVGLLFPTLRNARAAAKTTQCLSNLRQISLAIQSYVNDSNGRLPVLQNRGSTNDPWPALDTVLLPEVNGSRAVFGCPADDKNLFVSTGTSYFWNFTVNGQDLNRLFSIAGGDEPTRVPLLSDKEAFHPDTKDRVNILYADGHAAKELRFSTSLP
ncbi:MAG: type II secretion system protein [Verrucomicrobiota bacterium]